MAELVQNNINGFTFKVGSSDELALIIRNISNDPMILNNLQSGRDIVVDMKDNAKEIINIYGSLI